MAQESIVPPGSTIGILGGGQLGKMLAEAASQLGYRTHVYCPDPDSPAFSVASEHTVAPYDDLRALREFGSRVAVVTFEFENIPTEAMEQLPAGVRIRPKPSVLHVCQNRQREKRFLKEHGFALAEFLELPPATPPSVGKHFQFPAVLKTAGFGYDGKGQYRVGSYQEFEDLCARTSAEARVLERWVDFSAEISVIVARNLRRESRCWGAFENRHSHHILDTTLWPSTLDSKIQFDAAAMAVRIAEALDVVGLLAVECFVEKSGRVLVNELAPRPHNSGHITMDCSLTGQFEQHIRAITGLPFGEVGVRHPGAMVNLLGDLWSAGEPKWETLRNNPGVFLHLYGKREARPGRKMGHLNVWGDTAVEAASRAVQLRSELR